MTKQFFYAAAAAVILFAGCSKYPEGPKFSLASKTGRLANTWKIEKATDKNGIDFTSWVSGYSFEFVKDGKYEETWGSLTVNGTWAFSDDKESVYITVSTDIDTMNILKLASKELWFKDTDDSEYQCIPQ